MASENTAYAEAAIASLACSVSRRYTPDQSAIAPSLADEQKHSAPSATRTPTWRAARRGGSPTGTAAPTGDRDSEAVPCGKSPRPSTTATASPTTAAITKCTVGG